MGVITYFLLAGYTPFDRDTQQHEMEAIIAGVCPHCLLSLVSYTVQDYKFEPAEYWANVSETAKAFIRECLTIDPVNRPTAAECLQHKVRPIADTYAQGLNTSLQWLADDTPHFVPDPERSGGPTDLLPHVKKAFNAKQLCRSNMILVLL